MDPKNLEPFSAMNIYVTTKNVPSQSSVTIHGGVKNTPPAPSNPAPPPATTPPAPAARTPANSPNVPFRNTSPLPTAAGTNATWTIVCACARPRIVFAIATSVPRQTVGS
ncbi:uncharacterized protein EAF02_010032 [Botrytis sinoallii]|uniref:uncharacterized protein n=1 Tax=Botrytis sinoallii TaxID=1463999 RepID=UPI0019017353|nr:uncharacterized protein EAF02_010032 [Botrytis sinoallii]KAF7865609.1 hypothetical protein EAF02_010032 [Botrytis sinoallii]